MTPPATKVELVQRMMVSRAEWDVLLAAVPTYQMPVGGPCRWQRRCSLNGNCRIRNTGVNRPSFDRRHISDSDLR